MEYSGGTTLGVSDGALCQSLFEVMQDNVKVNAKVALTLIHFGFAAGSTLWIEHTRAYSTGWVVRNQGLGYMFLK